MDWRSREELRDMDQYDDRDDNSIVAELEDNLEPEYLVPPPGEEGAELSHEGGEYAVYQRLYNDLKRLKKGPKRYENRTRHDRTEIRTRAWETQMDTLTDTYLQWQMEPLEAFDAPSPNSWGMRILDLHKSRILYFPTLDIDRWTNQTLLRYGCLGTAPLSPHSAFSLRTLSQYHETHRVCPRLSIEAEIRALCNINKIPYQKSLADQFRIVYDAYLEILGRVQTQVNTVLGRDKPNWRALNVCPACDYRLEGEPSLKYSKLVSLDGNNSLRRVDLNITRGVLAYLDSRKARSDYWILPQDVDMFKNQVKAKAKRKAKDLSDEDMNEEITQPSDVLPADNSDEEQDTLVETEEPGDVADGASFVSVCIQRWRNAGPDERKKMWQMFIETGIFIAVCRHGFLLYLCDMIQSGELAKYGLAIVDKLIDVYGDGLCIGYDIGCAFASTVASSPLLAPKALSSGLRFVVPTFHGHAHNRGCQLTWHPLYLTEMGLEDFEGCERVFSFSNHLAGTTRNATTFHRHQAIEEHFKYWDELKYANLSVFLLSNYKQALETISTLETEITILKAAHNITDADFERFMREEKDYLANLKKPRGNDLEFQYVDALEALEDAECLTKQFQIEFINEPGDGSQPDVAARRRLANISRTRAAALNKYDKRLGHVVDLEAKLGIAEDGRWHKEHPKRLEVVELMNSKDYHVALDHLERLVVQRLFELTKMNMSSTGYSLRTHIGESLRRRSEAIRTALMRYNKFAVLVNPPRDPLSWDSVIKYSFLAEFDLLRFSHDDPRDKPWANPAIREGVISYCRLHCACAEIERLNIEIPQLSTAIADELDSIPVYIEKVKETNAPLAHEISRWWTLRSKTNTIHLDKIMQAWKLPGNSLKVFRGTRIGNRPVDGLENHPQSLQNNMDFQGISGVDCRVDGVEGENDDSSGDEDEIIEGIELLTLWEDRIDSHGI
ncbi:hypothetical protein M422DRAFT_234713 [Sphaerobolus stellatus SS14]|uniref:CxC1-like cysteine cluster associated with KDZ transposases domain-containing protein n=1 Tax=Sphaerobolus stellatus (strain SS14) TaxID=990650 RepID=A0A0C9UPG9_SPHS4|nr:hypothetical protein M422DRAFT_234713 [Sphaerobolus stellatus SS14]